MAKAIQVPRGSGELTPSLDCFDSFFDRDDLFPAAVTITRTSEADFKSRQLVPSIDGRHAGDLLWGDSITCELEPGPHRLRVHNTLVWKTVDFALGPGEQVFFEVINRGGPGTLAISSLFVYCTRVLRLSEHAAYGRSEGARAARRWPSVLGMLEAGELTLTTLSLVAPHLSHENHRDVLSRARYRSKREVEEIIAALRPRPDVPSLVRQLPQARPAAPVAEPADRIARRCACPDPDRLTR